MSNKEAVKRYQEKRDSIMLRPSKEDGQEIRNAAKVAGQSVQAYILSAVWERIYKEQSGQQTSGGGSGFSSHDDPTDIV